MNVMFIFLWCLFVGSISCWSCKSTLNDDVDFFLIIKPPRNNSKDVFYYYDQFMADENLETMELYDNLTDDTNPLFMTLIQTEYPTDMEKLIKLTFNDQIPNVSIGKRFAHSKGALYFHHNTGFYLQMSAPKFIADGLFDYPESATKLGRHFFCFSLDETNLKTVASHLYFSKPYMFSKTISDYFLNEPDKIFKNINSDVYEQVPAWMRKNIHTLAGDRRGLKIDIFTKSYKSSEQLWYKVSDLYDQPFNLITYWTGNDLHPSKYPLLKNVKHIYTNDGTSWPHTREHSKIGLSNGYRLCLSDLNYEKSQSGRSGGIFCVTHKKLITAIRNKFHYTCTGKGKKPAPCLH